MEKTVNLFMDTPVGGLTLTADDKALTGVTFGGEEISGAEQELTGPAGDILREARRQLTEYFAGERREFELCRLPIRLSGTEFTQQVGRAMLSIPYGEVRTYGETAAAIGRPEAVRAVGGACHRNPICIIVPCHRVVGAGGKLTGFGGGLAVKEWLLRHEGVRCVMQR
ncbi:MAG: methylated-DNA--[protein]-cysteine S-methyltransferase [Selenomonadaceae bacterium]|nr:methylated-DNA--[protein]-cysteine S-methyltransferase [Selenomonadaceae bacterium]